MMRDSDQRVLTKYSYHGIVITSDKRVWCGRYGQEGMASKREKRIERFLSFPKDMKLEEVHTVLEDLGCTHVRTAGDHFHYKHEDVPELITIVKRRGIIPVEYLKAAAKELGLR